MSRRHFIIRLRIGITVLVVTLLLSLIGGLFYLQEKGFSGDTAKRLAIELERYGLYSKFDHLGFNITEGLTATGVSFYQSPKRETQIAYIPSISIHIDKTKLMRGILKVNTVSIKDATVSLPLIKNIKDSPIVKISHVYGSIDLSNHNIVSTSNLRGTYQGIDIALNSYIVISKKTEQNAFNPQKAKKIVTLYNTFIDHLQQWSWSPSSPPQLTLFIDGQLSKIEKSNIQFKLQAPSVIFKNYPFENVLAQGDFNHNLITVDQFHFTHDSEACRITTDFDIKNFNGRFKIQSEINPHRFAQQVLNKQILTKFNFAGKTQLQATGKYQLPISPHTSFQLSALGKISCSEFSFGKTSVHTLKSDFSWNDGNLFLSDLKIRHNLGELTGKLLINKENIRYHTESSLPAEVYFPFIKKEILVEKLSDLTFSEKSYIAVTTTGFVDPKNLKNWQANGSATLKKFSYKDVPIEELKTLYTMNRSEATFSKTTVAFDYSQYALYKQFKTSKSGIVTADSLYFNWKNRHIQINKLRGSAWPAPLLRLFFAKAANHLEQYKFHFPPRISSSGNVYWGKKTPAKTNLKIGFSSTGLTEYAFLKKFIKLSDLKGQVTVLHDKIQVNKLSAKACKGNIQGYVHVQPSNQKYSGRLRWNALQLPSICETYTLKNKIKGTLDGSLTFRGRGSDISTFNGHGTITLNHGDLFGVPLFGPLSSLVDGIIKPISNKRLLHDQARNLAASYIIKNGVIYTNNLVSHTANTTFTGEGDIDLTNQSMDMTIRMNYRGLMGLAEIPVRMIELPIQALQKLFTGKNIKGLRQFHGSGSLSDPQWSFAPFSIPKDGKNNPLFKN